MSANELNNWIAIYVATGACCLIAFSSSVTTVGIELVRERAWRQGQRLAEPDPVRSESLVAMAEALSAEHTGDVEHRRLVCGYSGLGVVNDWSDC